jgi:hypothetical protein
VTHTKFIYITPLFFNEREKGEIIQPGKKAIKGGFGIR